MKKTYHLVALSGLMIAGQMAVEGDLIEVNEAEARNFLHRKKARVATAEDGAPEDEDGAELMDHDAPEDEDGREPVE